MNRGIYMITNLINGKKYIGQGYISTRISKHKKGIGSKIVANAIKEYGIENFEFKTLVICEDSDMDYYETSLIKSYDTIAPNGYNLETGGNKQKTLNPDTLEKKRISMNTLYESQEARDKISKSQLKRFEDPIEREKNRKHLDDYRKKLTYEQKIKRMKPVVSEDGSLFFINQQEARKAGYGHATSVATGIRTQCKGHKFHFMSPLEIEQYLGVSA
jgi:group I intron endonuclease